MENNGNEQEKNLQDTVKTAEEVGHLVKDTVNVVKDVGTQNWGGVVKDAYNILTNKAIWKTLKIIMIPIIAILLIPAVIGAMVFGVLSAVKDVVIDLINTISGFISNIVQWITNDYWIDINEEKEYMDSSGTTKIGTTVDQYIDELDNLGISLKSLRLLGDSEEDYEKALEDPETEKIVKKYISEFVRADIITQNFHRRHGNTEDDLVSSSTETPDAENLIDGGIFIKTNTINDIAANDSTFLGISGEKTNEVTDVDFSKDIKFVDYEDLQEDVNNINQNSNKYPDTSKLKQFSINNEGDISVIKLEVTTTDDGGADIIYNAKAEIVNYDYKTIIAKYSMPFEFLINLCEVTQNPEFVYHVARLARSTNIQLAIPYNIYYEQEKTIKECEITKSDATEKPDDCDVGDTLTFETTVKTEMWQPQAPVLKSADTWSFADKNTFKYNETISTETDFTSGSEDTAIRWDKEANGNIVEVPISVDYEGTKEKRKYSIEYSQAEGSISVEKSKRFLGLLRNETGTCVCDDCYENWSSAQTCAEDAVFKKSGTNVKYAIPNSGKLEEPLHKLESGIEMLYVLLENSLGTIKDAEVEKQSAYTEKMQGIVTHLRYLMTYPENEEDIDLEDYDINEEDNQNSGNGQSSGKTPTSLMKYFPNGLPQTDAEMQKYLVSVRIKTRDTSGNTQIKSIRVHHMVSEDVEAIFENIYNNSTFKAYDVQSYSWRETSTGTGTRSHHSYGLAIDINVKENYCIKNGNIVAGEFWDPQKSEFSIPTNGTVVNSFKTKGWKWGGEWNSSKDYMHFSATGG